MIVSKNVDIYSGLKAVSESIDRQNATLGNIGASISDISDISNHLIDIKQSFNNLEMSLSRIEGEIAKLNEALIDRL